MRAHVFRKSDGRKPENGFPTRQANGSIPLFTGGVNASFSLKKLALEFEECYKLTLRPRFIHETFTEYPYTIDVEKGSRASRDILLR